VIVVGYIPDQFGTAALEQAIAEAKLRDTNLLVINTSKGDSLADPRFAQGDELRALEELLADSGVEYELSHEVGVDAASTLLSAMERDDAELLVLGLRRRNPVGKLLLGSTAQHVLLECPKPVLAVKPEEQ
jgi:nucleotide-binding universal stress UspA family protein